MTVENSTLSQESVKLLRTLNTVALALQQSTGTLDDLSRVFQTQLEAVDLDGVIILLDDAEHWMNNPDAVAIVFANSISNPTIRQFAKKLNLSINNFRIKLANADIIQKVVRTQKTQFIPNSQLSIRQYLPPKALPFAEIIARAFKNISSINAPIFKKNQVIGMLAFASADLTPADIPTIEAFAHHISIALENTRLIQDLRAEIIRRETAETSLLTSRTRYQLLVESVPIPIAIHDGENILFVNSHLKKWLGIADDSVLVGKSIWKFIAPKSQPLAKQRIQAILEQGIQSEVRHEQFIRPDGEICDAEVLGTPINYEGKSAVLVVVHDISIHIRTQQQFKHYLAQLALLNEVGLEISKMLNLEHLFERTTTLIHQKFGYHHVSIFIRNDDENKLLMKAYAGAYATLPPKNLTLPLGKGMIGWVARYNQSLIANDVTKEPTYYNPLSVHQTMKTRAELSIPLNNGGAFCGVLDIQSHQVNAFDDQQVMVLETLAQQISIAAENAQLYHDAKINLEHRSQTADLLARHNQDLTLLNRIISITATNQCYTEKLYCICKEFSRAFDLSHVVIGHFTTEDFSEVTISTDYRTDPSQEDLSNKKIILDPTSQFPMWLQHSNDPLVITDIKGDPHIKAVRSLIQELQLKTVLFLHLRTNEKMPFLLAAGTQVVRTFSDNELSLATRVAEQISNVLKYLQLEQTRAKLSTAIEQSTESIVITNMQGFIVYCNSAFEKISGYKCSNLIGKHTSIMKSENRERIFAIISQLKQGKAWEGNLRQLRKDGTSYVAETSIVPMKNAQGEVENHITIQRDITQKLELEAQLRQSQKMEAVGRLAAGIAHDFNNMLTAINGFSELLISRTHAGSVEQDYALQILESGNRAASLVSQLLAYSRKQLTMPKVTDLNQNVLHIQQLLQRVLSKNIEIEIDLAPDLNLVKIDPAQLEQIMMNLSINAGDAMPKGGTLTLKTTNVFLDAAYAASHPETNSGNYVLLSVSDTGEGIDEAIQAHIFDPFFTTKEMGKGTGLGLATVYGIVKQNKGDIELKSEVGKGSTFNVYLPVTEEKPIDKNTDNKLIIPEGKETILLVEDNDNVLDLVLTILDDLGYQVLHARNGREALAQIDNYPHKIDLLLTDVMMPQMDGKHLANYLRKNNPAQKVLFISGYDINNLNLGAEMAQPGVDFLSKPFMPSALAHKLRELLDSQKV